MGRVLTLDEYASNGQLGAWPVVDLLSIDAEGYDPLILEGASSLLAQHRVRSASEHDHYCIHLA